MKQPKAQPIEEKPINRWIRGVPDAVWASFSGMAKIRQMTHAELFALMVQYHQKMWIEDQLRSGAIE